MNVSRKSVPHLGSTRAPVTSQMDLAPVAARGRSLSLADGALGEVLLNVERALTYVGSWDEVTKVYDTDTVETGALRGDGMMPEGLFYGSPAAVFVMDGAGADGVDRYGRVLKELDVVVEALTRERLTAARHRSAAGVAATADELNLFTGLIGLATLLLRRAPRSQILGGVVEHAVDLTKDRLLDRVSVPGWWTSPGQFAPERGHAELGMVQGAAGLLAFLAIAVRAGRGRDVPRDAFERLVGWLGDWRQEDEHGWWWPHRLTLDELRTGRATQPERSAPTWAGTVGIARALQMAAIVTGRNDWRATAESAMTSALSPHLLDQLTEPDLVTGTAGAYQTAFRAAQDAASPLLRQRLATAADALVRTGQGWPENTAFLTGRAGTQLADQTRLRRYEPVSGWDRCLLIAWAHS